MPPAAVGEEGLELLCPNHLLLPAMLPDWEVCCDYFEHFFLDQLPILKSVSSTLCNYFNNSVAIYHSECLLLHIINSNKALLCWIVSHAYTLYTLLNTPASIHYPLCAVLFNKGDCKDFVTH